MEGKFNSIELWNDVMQKKFSHLFRVNVHAIYNLTITHNLTYSPNLSNIQLQLEQRTAKSQREEPGTRTNQNH